MIRIEVSVTNGLVGCRHTRILEVDESEVEGLPEDEVMDYLEGSAREEMFDMLDWNWKVIE